MSHVSAQRALARRPGKIPAPRANSIAGSCAIPIKIYRERLLQFGVAEKVIADIDAQVRKMVDDATEACKAAPPPPLDIIATDVYADGGWAWRN
jgi:TPP-dependent pyruvate/acetoin dehydrogenase alpha subunit